MRNLIKIEDSMTEKFNYEDILNSLIEKRNFLKSRISPIKKEIEESEKAVEFISKNVINGEDKEIVIGKNKFSNSEEAINFSCFLCARLTPLKNALEIYINRLKEVEDNINLIL